MFIREGDGFQGAMLIQGTTLIRNFRVTKKFHITKKSAIFTKCSNSLPENCTVQWIFSIVVNCA